MTVPESRLIYDIGLFDGEDTAYYLSRGHRVLAVDANPIMVERARLRFAKEILDQRLKLLNVGISMTPSGSTFWISDVPEWSSFDKKIASRDGTACRPASVAVVPFSQVLKDNGPPYYLKIDIEGNDRLCVEALDGEKLPTFISVEAECTGDADVLSDDEAIAMLELLRHVGYRRFKLVSQRDWTPVRPGTAHRFMMKLLNSAARGRLRVEGICEVADRISDAGRVAALGYKFSQGSSGPWGDDIPGSWMTFQEAKSAYLRERRSFFSKNKPLYLFWYDWHATY